MQADARVFSHMHCALRTALIFTDEAMSELKEVLSSLCLEGWMHRNEHLTNMRMLQRHPFWAFQVRRLPGGTNAMAASASASTAQ